MKMKWWLNQKGMTLVEVMVSIGIASMVSLAMMRINETGIKTTNKSTTDLDLTLFRTAVLEMNLAKPENCLANFNGDSAATAQNVVNLVNDSAVEFVTTVAPNNKTADGSWQIDSMTLGAFVPSTSGGSSGRCDLAVNVTRNKIAYGSQTRVLRIPIFCMVTNPTSTKNITSCMAASGNSDSIWQLVYETGYEFARYTPATTGSVVIGPDPTATDPVIASLEITQDGFDWVFPTYQTGVKMPADNVVTWDKWAVTEDTSGSEPCYYVMARNAADNAINTHMSLCRESALFRGAGTQRYRNETIGEVRSKYNTTSTLANTGMWVNANSDLGYFSFNLSPNTANTAFDVKTNNGATQSGGGYLAMTTGGYTSLGITKSGDTLPYATPYQATVAYFFANGGAAFVKNGLRGGSGNLNTSGADADQELVFGDNIEAWGKQVVGFGKNIFVSGDQAYVHGGDAAAQGNYTFAHGNTVFAGNTGSIVFGQDSSSNGVHSFSQGHTNQVSGDYSVIHGLQNTVTAAFGFAQGNQNTVSNNYGWAVGRANTVAGAYGSAFGFSNEANGQYSMGFGYNNTVDAPFAGAIGSNNDIDADENFAYTIGNYLQTDNTNQVIVGRYNSTTGPIGPRVFVVGSGTGPAANQRKNALEVFEDGTTLAAGGALLAWASSDITIQRATPIAWGDGQHRALVMPSQLQQNLHHTVFGNNLSYYTPSSDPYVNTQGNYGTQAGRTTSTSTSANSPGSQAVMMSSVVQPDGGQTVSASRLGFMVSDSDGCIMHASAGAGCTLAQNLMRAWVTSTAFVSKVNFYANGGAVAGNATSFSWSDRRLKKDVTKLENSLEKILKIEGKAYVWKEVSEIDPSFNDSPMLEGWSLGGKKEFGFIAQEVEKVLPEAVATMEDQNKTKTVRYTYFIPLILESVKEFYQEFKVWVKKLVGVENKVSDIEREVASLKEENRLLKEAMCELKPNLGLCLNSKNKDLKLK